MNPPTKALLFPTSSAHTGAKYIATKIGSSIPQQQNKQEPQTFPLTTAKCCQLSQQPGATLGAPALLQNTHTCAIYTRRHHQFWGVKCHFAARLLDVWHRYLDPTARP